jgi:NTE family protein
VLPDEAVDRLRSAAGTIISDSPEFKRLLKEVGGTIVAPGTTHAAATDQGALARECRRP